MKKIDFPKHFFVSESGELFDTRKVCWWAKPPLRKVFKKHFPRIENSLQLKATLRAGPYTFPGGYPLALLTSEGTPICFSCVEENFREELENLKSGKGAIVATFLVAEEGLFCEICGKEF